MRPLSGHWNPGCNQQAGRSLKYYHPRACRAIAVETQEARHHSTQLNQPCWHSTAIRQLSNSGSLPSVLFLEYELFYRYFWPLHVLLRRENHGFSWWEKGFYFSAIFCSWSSPTSLVAQNNSFLSWATWRTRKQAESTVLSACFRKKASGMDWIGHLMKFRDPGLSNNPKPLSCSKTLTLDYLRRNREELTFKPLLLHRTLLSLYSDAVALSNKSLEVQVSRPGLR